MADIIKLHPSRSISLLPRSSDAWPSPKPGDMERIAATRGASMPFVPKEQRPKVRLYNVYKHEKLVYGSATFIQCTRYMALQVGEADGVITLAQAFEHGFTMKAIA